MPSPGHRVCCRNGAATELGLSSEHVGFEWVTPHEAADLATGTVEIHNKLSLEALLSQHNAAY